MPIPYPRNKLLSESEFYKLGGFTSTKIWIMRNFDAVRITDLRKTHIKSILDMMDKNPIWRAEFKPILIAELRRRKKEEHFIKTSKAGKILYDKAKV